MRTVRLLFSACTLTACSGQAFDVPPSGPSAATVTAVGEKTPSRYERFLLAPGLAPYGETAAPEDVGIEGRQIDWIVANAIKTRTTNLIVMAKDRVLVERYEHGKPEPLLIASVTKAVLSLLVGQLLEEGLIPSLDTPVSKWFPEWSTGWRAQVTVRHLMNHTSGIDHDQGDDRIVEAHDSFSYVRRHSVPTPPGTTYSYNNDAVQLLGAIIHSATHEHADELLRKRIFLPLGIETASWFRDDLGAPFVYAGLKISPRDLATLGRLMLDGGRFKNKQIVPSKWISAMTTMPSSTVTPMYGLLWALYFGRDMVALSDEFVSFIGKQKIVTGSLDPAVFQPMQS